MDELRRISDLRPDVPSLRSPRQRARSLVQRRRRRAAIPDGGHMSQKPVVIFGIGSFAQVAAVYLDRDSSREVVGYTVDGQYVDTDSFAGLPVTAFEDLVESHPPDRVDLLVATGFRGVNTVRRQIYERAREAGYGFVSYVSSHAMKMSDHEVGENT